MRITNKQTLRTIFKKRRQELIAIKGISLTDSLGKKLKQCIEMIETTKQKNITTIGSYFPDVKREIIPPQLDGYQYAYPHFSKKGKADSTPLMEFKPYKNQSKQFQVIYGLKVPPKELITVFPELVLVPLLCFSPELKQRIGYGGGYYDRYINFSREKGLQTVFVGIGAEILKTQQEFQCENDEPLDFIITQSHIY